MSRAARTSLITLLALTAAVAACRRARPAEPRRTYAHPNGLTLAAPETFAGRRVSVIRTPTGFAAYTDPRATRYAARALVTFNADRATPAGIWPDKQAVDGRTIHSVVDSFPDASVGSGGPEYELRAWESARGGHVAYSQHVQTEGEPDFGLLWAIIEGTKPPS